MSEGISTLLEESIDEKQEGILHGDISNPEKIVVEELLKRPDDLSSMAYLLLTLTDLDPKNLARRLTTFLQKSEEGLLPKEDSQAIEETRGVHEEKYARWRQEQLQRQHVVFEKQGVLNTEAENLDDLYCIHCTNYLPSVGENRVIIRSTFQGSGGELLRTTIHTSLNHTVGPVSGMGGGFTWEYKDYVIVSPLKKIIELNGLPYGLLPEDTWWGVGTKEGLVLPEGTIIMARNGDNRTAQLQNQQGITIIEVDGKPHDEAEKVMQDRGIKIISPRYFRGAKRIADQLGVFYGYHLGSASKEGSENYLWAEAVIESASDKDKQIRELVDLYNFDNTSPFVSAEGVASVNFHTLSELAFLGYFSGDDFPSISDLLAKTGPGDVEFDEVISAMTNHYYSRDHSRGLQYESKWSKDERKRFVAGIGLKVFDEIGGMAKNRIKLPPISKAMLEQKVSRVRENLEIVPPQLVGALTAKIWTSVIASL